MTRDLFFDEEQYLAAGYFARYLTPYRDFVLLQPPTYIWLLAAGFALVDGWYLLTARLIVWAFDVGACFLMYSLCIRSWFRLFDDDVLIQYARHAGYKQVAKEWNVNSYPGGQVWIRPKHEP